jgi:hypothetical protein
MLLVVWAASFGVDERGVPDNDHDELAGPSPHDIIDIPQLPGSDSRRGNVHVPAEGERTRETAVERRRRDRREKTEAMIREVLELIDMHGVMRRPTWDGVRVLLLVLPLMEGKCLLKSAFTRL